MDLIDGCLGWHGNFAAELYERLIKALASVGAQR